MKFKVIKEYKPSKNTTYYEGARLDEDDPAYQFLKENYLIDKYLEEIKPELTYKPFTPDYEEYYYYVKSFGEITNTINTSWNIDKIKINSGNAFRTEEEAEYYRDWLIARKRIMDSSDFVPDWQYKYQSKYIITYNHDEEEEDLIVNHYHLTNFGSPAYYRTEDQAEQAAKDLANEYLVYFGVKRKLEEQ